MKTILLALDFDDGLTEASLSVINKNFERVEMLDKVKLRVGGEVAVPLSRYGVIQELLGALVKEEV